MPERVTRKSDQFRGCIQITYSFVHQQHQLAGCNHWLPMSAALPAFHPLPMKTTQEGNICSFCWSYQGFWHGQSRLCFEALLKSGIPEELVDVVRCMYADCKVQFKVGKEERDTEYITGVQQGDAVTQILFLFLMLVASSTLKRYGLTKPQNLGTSPQNCGLIVDAWEIRPPRHEGSSWHCSRYFL